MNKDITVDKERIFRIAVGQSTQLIAQCEDYEELVEVIKCISDLINDRCIENLYSRIGGN